mgnify:CR=1 FL=1
MPTVYFYPDYTSSNSYQLLLNSSCANKNYKFIGIKGFDNLCGLVNSSRIKKGDFLHLHWINDIFSNIPAEGLDERALLFFSLISQFKEQGGKLTWTVHNEFSHDCLDTSFEFLFRKKLCFFSDTIHLHHPILENKISWLACNEKIIYAEHGLYPVKSNIETCEIINSLGIPDDSTVFLVMGQIRDYKFNSEILESLKALMNSKRDFLVLFAGRVASNSFKLYLKGLPEKNYRLIDHFLSDQDLSALTARCDYGLLIYNNILTPGSLFHFLSHEKSIIAPNLGVIPCYIVNGVNGFVYTDSTSLSSLLINLISKKNKKFHDNVFLNNMKNNIKWVYPVNL